MGETGRMIEELYGALIEYARENHPEEIDRAYEHFWEEEDPAEFLLGTALDLGFVNFEDWLVCDYLLDGGEGLIDRYIVDKNPPPEAAGLLRAMKDSCISLYEVASTDGALRLRDIALGEEVEVEDPRLHGLARGYALAARLIHVGAGGGPVLGRCIYPFGVERKELASSFLDMQFSRYRKNRNPEADMAAFLREESGVFNMVWVTCLDT